MVNAIWFDMDGTIADLYGVNGWLDYLNNHNATPYRNATPLVNMSRLARLLHKAQRNGYTVNIVSWLARNSTADYDEEVATAKREWLARHLPSVEWNEIEIVAYGTPKGTIGNGILFDDEEHNRNEWGEGAFPPSEIFTILHSLS